MEIIHEFWSHDRKRKSDIVYDKEFNGFVVRMYEDDNKIKSVRMGTGEIKHSEQDAENAAENWVMGYYE